MFVERDGGGQVVGCYRWPQDGKTLEELADNHADVVAFQNPPPNLADYAAAKRRAIENGQTTIDTGSREIPVWTDPVSRGSILGLVVASGIVPGLTAPWKGADGEFYTITAAEMQAIALGIMAFVQECFAVEAAVLAGIGNDTIATTAEIDAADWPG
jgi:hypothetical protein